jgi:hypothetical protein
MSDFGVLLAAQTESKRRWAEREAANARWEIAKTNERIAYLLSQHEPVAELGLDREALRAALRYVQHGDLDRMHRERAE